MTVRSPLAPPETPKFWRDPALPFIETREIQDGRKVCYAKHAHHTFSMGAITGGRCIYLNGAQTEPVSAGSVVVIDPGTVHSCNPIANQPWSYRMLYVDSRWLARCQHAAGWGNGDEFFPFAMPSPITQSTLFDGLNQLYAILMDEQAGVEQKADVATRFFTAFARGFPRSLTTSKCSERRTDPRLEKMADYIRENCTRPLPIESLCVLGGLSPAHTIRLFKAKYGMTPHAYQVNCRVEYSRAQLRLGRTIADVAAEAGFSDQAHLQRMFKKMTAATPGQYQNGQTIYSHIR